MPVISFHSIIPLGIVLVFNVMFFAVNAYCFNNRKNVIFIFLSDSPGSTLKAGALSPERPLTHHEGGQSTEDMS